MDLVLDCTTGEEETRELPPLPLAERKAQLWAAVKAVRDARIDGGCTVAGIGTFDTDAGSRLNINGAVTGAMLAEQAGAPFEVQWKLADNSLVTLDGAQMIAVGQTVLARTSACHARSQALGAEIEEAEDDAAIEAIDIGAGWPE